MLLKKKLKLYTHRIQKKNDNLSVLT